MKKKIRHLMRILFLIIGMLKTVSLTSQLHEEYIKNYIEKYSQNKALNDIYLSKNGLTYAYQKEDTDTCIVQSDKKNKFQCNQILLLDDIYIYYRKNNKIFKRYLNDINKEIELNKNDIQTSLQKKDFLVLLFKNNEFIIIHKNKKEYKGFFKKYESKDIKPLTKLQYLQTNKNSIIIGVKKTITIEDNIDRIIPGINESLLISKEHLYIYNNEKEIISQKAKNDLTSHILESNNKIKTMYIDGKIILKTQQEENTIKNNVITPTPYLDLAQFRKISLSYDNFTKTISLYKVYDIKEKNIKNINIVIPNNFYDEIFKDLYIIQQYISFRNKIPEIKEKVINVYLNKTLNLDSLNIKYTNYHVTPDAKKILISTSDKKLFIYTFEKNKLTLLRENFPFTNYSYEYILNENLIYINNESNNEIIINTNTVPYFIKNSESIDSIINKKIEKGIYTKNYIYPINSNKEYILLTLNLKSNNSKLSYIIDSKVIELSSNDNYKSLQSKLNTDNLIQNGFIKKENNHIYWTEINLKNGIKYYKYDIKNNLKEELYIETNKIHDSLNYIYKSIIVNKEIITGCIKFPKKYDSLKKYPVLIQVYLNKRDFLHFTGANVNPQRSIQNKSYSAILNDVNLLHQDYIICYIDVPIVNHFYSSNSNFINLYINKVFPEINSIDMSNIGITGHSRSAGQVLGALVEDTKIKCAIISNGITSELIDLTTFNNPVLNYDKELTSSIKSIEKNSRFLRRYIAHKENKNFYQDLKNDFKDIIDKDPFFKLKKINSSILFLFNDNDGSINSSNGYFTYIKTKLLEKNTYLLNFIKETHLIQDESNANLCYNYLIDYLNFFLKNNNKADNTWVFSNP
jgi:hypothetical protein